MHSNREHAARRELIIDGFTCGFVGHTGKSPTWLFTSFEIFLAFTDLIFDGFFPGRT